MRHAMGQGWNGKVAILRLPVLIALWTLILVTLLSALAPLGPPLSRATGSAFNPATTDVVLKARAQAAAQLVAAPRPDGDGAPPLILALALAIILLAGLHVRRIASAARPSQNPRSFAPARTRRARAPPAAS
ncbi:hypothetical protein [Sphingobium cupriresistens]|uniref:Uncharacterized protein n=2 Tax=Sphingobium cupriresistens TaxID=1132417 RepID=A0A0J8AM26_9SPHN|nr:hypothetical protein [Sphingobium cupriresistens]KMS55625.1 hypothetical protein V473_12855 [Sphingobium cupriresistens LL01]